MIRIVRRLVAITALTLVGISAAHVPSGSHVACGSSTCGGTLKTSAIR